MFYNVLFNSLYIFYKISKYKNAISVKINSFTLYYHYQNISLLIYNSIALFIHKKRGFHRNPLLIFGLTTICIEEVNSNFWEHSVSQYVFVSDTIVTFGS